jgi:hypothetical protein
MGSKMAIGLLILSENETGDLRECVLRAASLRGFLG